MESFAVMIITVPIITPLVTGMGYDIIWWGIAMLCVVETGLIHPPFGLNVIVLKELVRKPRFGQSTKAWRLSLWPTSLNSRCFCCSPRLRSGSRIR